jgi:peptidoglycan-associated lipoprotein
MKFNKKITNLLIIVISTLALSACSTAKKTGVGSGDVYTGNDTVEYLATGVKDRVFFATNSSSLTTASRDTLRKQAGYLRKSKKLNVVLEGHADERGTREYNLALGEKRANSAKDYSVISYGKEKPVNSSSTPLAWSQNRRSVTIKAK